MDPKILQQQYNALGSVYNPEVQLINQQMAAIPGQTAAQKSALEQARVNAFRDITSQAQGRGVYFSGFRPSEEARYTGERFLPALAELEGQSMQARTSLQKALIDVNQRRQQQAMSQAQTILDRQQQERQFQQELAANRSSGGGGGGGQTPTYFTRPSEDGGINFFSPQGQPITAAQYYAGQGGNFGDVVNFLQQNYPQGNALRDIRAGLSKDQLQRKYPYIFGGV